MLASTYSAALVGVAAELVRVEADVTFGLPAFTIVGLPCNQFMGQEPGSAEEIQEFCSATYGVTFPMTEKIEVNGEGRHPLYAELAGTPDEQGEAGEDLGGRGEGVGLHLGHEAGQEREGGLGKDAREYEGCGEAER